MKGIQIKPILIFIVLFVMIGIYIHGQNVLTEREENLKFCQSLELKDYFFACYPKEGFHPDYVGVNCEFRQQPVNKGVYQDCSINHYLEKINITKMNYIVFSCTDVTVQDAINECLKGIPEELRNIEVVTFW